MGRSLEGRTVVLGVTGGVAAYKAADLTSKLVKEGAQVRVVMTGHACQFVSPATFESLSGGPVYTQLFHQAYEIGHISLAKSAHLLAVAPATANILAKMAAGIADDLLSTTYLAAAAPVLVAPAMNAAMWRHPATQRNLDILRQRGVEVAGPARGHLACGDEDVGRMEEPQAILERIKQLLCREKDLAGRRVLVTAGPTREMIDPVRFLSNRSTGRMGYAIAQAALDRGAQVTLVSGPVSIPAPQGARLVSITSTQQLYGQVTALAQDCDAVVQAAAPADFTPERYSQDKIKKTGEDMVLRLTPTPDIAKALGQRKRPGQVLVAFAAETGDLTANAHKKLLSKNADFVVANDVTQPGAGFAVDTNQVTLVSREGETRLPLMSKEQVAHAIWDRVLALWEGR